MATDLLRGIRVLDLSLMYPGPFCAMHLGDLGADVIKIEPPKTGDMCRQLRTNASRYVPSMSLPFMSANRNKRSLALSIKKSQGRDLLKQLVLGADVLIEGFKPGLMDSLELGHGHLAEINPRLIYCHISGYGAEGPKAKVMGHDGNFIAESGILDASGTKGGPPSIPGVLAASMAGGSLFALSGILAALFHREKTGNGHYVDASSLDGALSLMTLPLALSMASEKIPERGLAELTGKFANYSVYECKDGKYLMVAPIETNLFDNLLELLNRKDLIGAENELLKSELEKIFRTNSRDFWSGFFAGHNVCVSPVLNIAEALASEQTKARGMVFWQDSKDYGPLKMINSPFRIDREKPTCRMPPPKVGEHTEEILRDIGLSAEDIVQLKCERVVQ